MASALLLQPSLPASKLDRNLDLTEGSRYYALVTAIEVPAKYTIYRKVIKRYVTANSENF